MGGYESPEQRRMRNRRYREKNRERLIRVSRDYYAANRSVQISKNQEYYRNRNPQKRLRDQIISELWLAQDGCCYLCEQPFPLAEMVLEHDHRCCPPHGLSFCRYCVRGAACTRCNKAIGHALDDPDRLELMARNLRAKIAEVSERLADKPTQTVMDW